MRGRNNNNTTPQESKSADAGLRIERARRKNPRHRLAHRGKIHPARAQFAEFRRSGGGGELLPARRALFPPDRAAQEQFRQQNPYYNNQQPQQGQNPPQGAADDDYDDGDDEQPFTGQGEPNYAQQPPRSRRSLICRATRSRFHRATSSNMATARSQRLSAALARQRGRARRRRSALVHHRRRPAAAERNPTQNSQNGHDKVAAATAGPFRASPAAAPSRRRLSSRTVRISATTTRKARSAVDAE